VEPDLNFKCLLFVNGDHLYSRLPSLALVLS
jgi:hypothetical protein